ncbi:MAG: Unknown protein [uncultured Thiotrichaceae bacterium]|uniref:Uncharacterized protein n=1 Tax=uncultured Thiotrichaceae bacterium TaxID=298394 RepID=A0A6S6SPK1_9GAMM|nr:MAG: Unknown protein [uncultured Thiotrichaceae bacterium]
MSCDIKFKGSYVIIEGSHAQFTTTDLMLDAPSRRKNNVNYRRALVHDHKDGLTINYNSDYPNGVTIDGETKVEDLTANKISSNQIVSKYIKANTIEAEEGGEVSINHIKTNRSQVNFMDAGLIEAAEVHGSRMWAGSLQPKEKNDALIIGASGATKKVELAGPGLLVSGGIQILGDSEFSKPLNVPDIFLVPGQVDVDNPVAKKYSLFAKIKELQKENASLKNQLLELTGRVQKLEERDDD